MAYTPTPTEIRAAVRSRADIVNSTHVTDAEIDAWVIEELEIAQDILAEVDPRGNQRARTLANTVTAGTPEYDVYLTPSPLVYAPINKILAVQILFDGDWRQVNPLDPWERRNYELDDSGWVSPDRVFYEHQIYSTMGVQGAVQVAATRITFYPTPQADSYFRVEYTPLMAAFTSDSFTLYSHRGLYEYVVSGAASKALEKGERWEAADRQLARQARAADHMRRHAGSLRLDGNEKIRDIHSEHPDLLLELYPDLVLR